MTCCPEHNNQAMNDQQGQQGEYYTCPMHSEIRQDKPGKCPKCGMDLVLNSIRQPADKVQNESQINLHANHASHDHASMMASPQAAADFLRRFFIVAVLLVPLAVFSMPGMKLLSYADFALRAYLEFAIATAIFYFGLVFFSHARHEIMAKQYGMMTLVSLAVGAGYLFSAAGTFIPAIKTEFYLEISTLIWVLLFGHFLEAKSSSAAGDALQEVAKLLPKEAHLLVEGQIKEVSLDQLKEGDVVLVKPGEKVPADGVIVKGEAHFNEAHLTGESRPVAKGEKAQAVAGAICLDGSVEIKLSQVGENSTIGQIQKLIAQAQQTKPSMQRLADRAARWLTFTALTVAVLTLLVWALLLGQTFVFAMTLAITVLVIACPHALGLAIPTVSTIATRLAVKNGLFVKDMAKLEVVKNVDYVVFDKTGTLTTGEFGVSRMVVSGATSQKRQDEKSLLKIVASLEQHSSHMIGQAIVGYAQKKGITLLPIKSFRNLAGKGISGTVNRETYFIGNWTLMEEKDLATIAAQKIYAELSQSGQTLVFVATPKQVIGAIGLSDQIKSESQPTVAQLHHLGVKVAMLTGDTQEVAETVAKQLGIDTVFARVLPEKKYTHIKKLQDDGNTVIMAGDGVNDAPALTQADVGVAIGAGTDVAVEAGDVVLTQSNPHDMVRLIVLARKVYRKMVENLFWAAGYNILAIPAAAGLFSPLGVRLTPEFGALLMSLSSVIVVVNAMTLRRVKLEVKTN